MILFHLFDNSRVNPSILCADPDRLVRGGGSNFDFSFKVTIVETREDRNNTTKKFDTHVYPSLLLRSVKHRILASTYLDFRLDNA